MSDSTPHGPRNAQGTWDRSYPIAGMPDSMAAFRDGFVETVRQATLRSTLRCELGESVTCRLRYVGGEQLCVGVMPVVPLTNDGGTSSLWRTGPPGWCAPSSTVDPDGASSASPLPWNGSTAPGASCRCDGHVFVAHDDWRTNGAPRFVFAPGQVIVVVLNRRVSSIDRPHAMLLGLERPDGAPAPVCSIPATAGPVALCVSHFTLSAGCSLELLHPDTPFHVFDVTGKATIYFGPRASAALKSLDAAAQAAMGVL